MSAIDFTKQLSQRTIYQHVREALRVLGDPVNAVKAPAVYGQAASILHQIFAAVPSRAEIFSPFLTHNLGVKKSDLLAQHYEVWHEASKEAAS